MKNGKKMFDDNNMIMRFEYVWFCLKSGASAMIFY